MGGLKVLQTGEHQRGAAVGHLGTLLGTLLTFRLVPGPPTGKPRGLSSSMAPKI